MVSLVMKVSLLGKTLAYSLCLLIAAFEIRWFFDDKWCLLSVTFLTSLYSLSSSVCGS